MMFFVVVFSLGLVPISDNFVQKASAAVQSDYAPVTARISISNGSRNINILGGSENSKLNTCVTNGDQNENWRFDYVTKDVFRIANMGTGMVM